METTQDHRWKWFLQQLQQDFLLWSIVVLLFQATRFGLVAIFRDQLTTGGISEIFAAALMGCRYDARIATIICLPSFVASIIGLNCGSRVATCFFVSRPRGISNT